MCRSRHIFQRGSFFSAPEQLKRKPDFLSVPVKPYELSRGARKTPHRSGRDYPSPVIRRGCPVRFASGLCLSYIGRPEIPGEPPEIEAEKLGNVIM